jgi:hypothetical protein
LQAQIAALKAQGKLPQDYSGIPSTGHLPVTVPDTPMERHRHPVMCSAVDCNRLRLLTNYYDKKEPDQFI